MSQVNESESTEFIRQVLRETSPTITRHEKRIKELEELLDLEAESRKRLERSNIELEKLLETKNSENQGSTVSSGQYKEAIRRRDADIARLRKDAEKLNFHIETSEQELRKRNNQSIMELKSEIETLQKQRQKSEKDKIVLMKELESSLVQCDCATKVKATLEARLENAECHLMRSRGVTENLEQQIKEVNNQKTQLSEENVALRSSVADVTSNNNSLRKVKMSLEEQLEERMKMCEEESRLREVAIGQNHRLQCEIDDVRASLEEETDGRHRLQTQLAKVGCELAALRGKYEQEAEERCREAEEVRRKYASKLTDLSDELSREHARVTSLEKNRQQLTLEVAGLTAELSQIESEEEKLRHSVKSVETANKDLDGQLQEQINETTVSKMTITKLSSENSRLRLGIEEEERKNLSLSKQNSALTSQLMEETDRANAVSKELSDIRFMKGQLESERMDLATSLEEHKEMLQDTERKYQSCHGSLLQLKSDMEQRLSEKNEELDSLKKSSQRTIEDLSTTLTDLELKYKTEMTKIKKKYDTQMKQLQENLENVQNEKDELKNEVQETGTRLKEVENALEEEKQDLLLVQEKLSSSERRRIQLSGDLDDSNRLLEAADKSRRNTQMEIERMSEKSADNSAQINSLMNDKRKLESEVASMKADLVDVTISKIDSEERAAKLANEANVLMDELRQEQELSRKCETLRKNMVMELKEVKIKLDQREILAVKDLAKNSQVFNDRIKELESELENERSRNKEYQVQVKKQERLMKDLQLEADDERSALFELQHLLEAAQMKISGYKRQVDELEVANAENLSRYRRAQKQIDNEVVVNDHRCMMLDRRSVLSSCSSFLDSNHTGLSTSSGAR